MRIRKKRPYSLRKKRSYSQGACGIIPPPLSPNYYGVATGNQSNIWKMRSLADRLKGGASQNELSDEDLALIEYYKGGG